MENRKLNIYSLFSGLLLGSGFLFPTLRFLSWFAILPLISFLELNKISSKKTFLFSFLAGFIFFGQAMSWLFHLWPLNWIGIENNVLGFFLIFLAWLILVGFLALFFGFFALSYLKLKRGGWFNLLLIPFLWIIFEYLRTWMVGFLFFGKESLLGPHWTFGNFGYFGAQNQFLRFLSSIGGIYFISFLIVFVNVFIFLLIRNLVKTKLPSKKLFFSLIILIILGLISFSYFYSPFLKTENIPSFKIAILQTKFPSFFHQTKEMAQEKFQTQIKLLQMAFQLHPDLDIFVFPEDSRFLAQKEAKEILAKIFPEREFLIIDSARTETPEDIKSIVTLYSTKRGTLTQYQKLLLAPAGEYLPYAIKLPAQIINKSWVNKFEKSRGYKKGKEIVVFSSNHFSGGALFCSEVFSPNLHRQFTKNDAQILFNLSSLAFSHGSKILDSQTQAILQLRAAENGKYLVRATNYGSSFIINDRGEIIKKSSNFENQIIFDEVPSISEKTPYIKFGDWILIFAFGISAFSLIKKQIKNEKFKV